MSIVFHDDPFTPVDRQPDITSESLGRGPGILRSVPVPGRLLPTASDAVRLRVGARSLPTGQWVSDPDDDWAPTIAMKRRLVQERPGEVIACLDGHQEACDEAAAGVLASIGMTSTTDQGIDALVDAASRVADDLCLLMPDDAGVHRLGAAVLCSPNRWRLADKVGGTVAAIHSPVARYSEDLLSPVDALMARMSPDRPVWRVNWGVSSHASLFQPDAPPVVDDLDPADMWFRVEWQTLRRLPVTGAVLFTIRTYVERLSDFMSRDYAVVHDVADLINKIPENVAVYKGIAPYRERIFDYLSSR